MTPGGKFPQKADMGERAYPRGEKHHTVKPPREKRGGGRGRGGQRLSERGGELRGKSYVSAADWTFLLKIIGTNEL